MGEHIQRDVIITFGADELEEVVHWFKGFKEDLEMDGMGHLLVGPIYLSNGHNRMFFSSSGSNEGWPRSVEQYKYCKRLMERFPSQSLLVTHGDGIAPSVRTDLREPE